MRNVILKFDFHQLVEKMNALSQQKKIVFSASCAERLFPGYQAFSEDEHWGDWKKIRAMLDGLWEIALGKQYDKEYVEQLIENCYTLGPDAEDFRSVLTGAAIDAGASLYYGLKCVLEDNPKYPAYAGNAVVDAVDRYLLITRKGLGPSVVTSTDREEVRKHPLMQQELEHQENDIMELSSSVELTAEIVHKIRKRSQQSPVPNDFDV